MKNIKDFILEQSNDNIQSILYNLEDGDDMIINTKFVARTEEKITKLAKHAGYEDVITLYTDKMEPKDLAPMPIPSHKDNVMPSWAKTIIDNQNKKYLLIIVFDKNNDKLMNALMPIYLEHELMGKKVKNMTCCLAITDNVNVSKPILSRAGGERSIIKL